jgi:hypothetical protein
VTAGALNHGLQDFGALLPDQHSELEARSDPGQTSNPGQGDHLAGAAGVAESQVRTGLAGGGIWIRTLSPALARGFQGVAEWVPDQHPLTRGHPSALT